MQKVEYFCMISYVFLHKIRFYAYFMHFMQTFMHKTLHIQKRHVFYVYIFI